MTRSEGGFPNAAQLGRTAIPNSSGVFRPISENMRRGSSLQFAKFFSGLRLQFFLPCFYLL